MWSPCSRASVAVRLKYPQGGLGGPLDQSLHIIHNALSAPFLVVDLQCVVCAWCFIVFLLDLLLRKLTLALYLCICVEDAYVEEDVREGIYIT